MKLGTSKVIEIGKSCCILFLLVVDMGTPPYNCRSSSEYCLTNGVIWWWLCISSRVGEWLLRKQFKNEIKKLSVIQVSFFLLTFHHKERINSKKAKKLSVTAYAAHPVLRGRNKEFYSCLPLMIHSTEGRGRLSCHFPSEIL